MTTTQARLRRSFTRTVMAVAIPFPMISGSAVANDYFGFNNNSYHQFEKAKKSEKNYKICQVEVLGQKIARLSFRSSIDDHSNYRHNVVREVLEKNKMLGNADTFKVMSETFDPEWHKIARKAYPSEMPVSPEGYVEMVVMVKHLAA